MFCSECGAKNPDDAAFCSECGKKLEKPQESASVSENNTTQNVQYQKVEEVQNVQNEQKVYTQSNQNKKSPFLKVVIVIVLLAILGGAIYFAYTKYFKDGNNSFLSGTTTKTEWGDKYLVYLNSAKAQTDKKARANEYGIPENAEELKIKFVEVPGLTDPIMVLNYVLDGKEYALIYYINKEGKVSLVTYNEATNVEYLYNIEAKTYSWYIHSTSAGTHKYTLLEKAITDLSVLNQDTNTQNVDSTNTTPTTTAEVTVDYAFTESEMSTKYNDTFIKPEIENSKGTDIDLDSEDDLKNTVDSAIDDYKPSDELLKEEEKKEVEEKAKEIEEKPKYSKIDESKDIVYTGATYNHYYLSAAYPVININTDTVKAINSEIYKEYGFPNNIGNSDDAYMDAYGEYFFETGLIGYKYFVNDKTLSLIVSRSGNESIWSDIYNINLKTGEKVSNSELLSMKNINNDEMLTKCKEIAVNDFDTTINTEPAGLRLQGYKESEIDEFRNDLINDLMNQTRLFLDENGKLCLVTDYRHAGGQSNCIQTIIIHIEENYRLEKLNDSNIKNYAATN